MEDRETNANKDREIQVMTAFFSVFLNHASADLKHLLLSAPLKSEVFCVYQNFFTQYDTQIIVVETGPCFHLLMSILIAQ